MFHLCPQQYSLVNFENESDRGPYALLVALWK